MISKHVLEIIAPTPRIVSQYLIYNMETCLYTVDPQEIDINQDKSVKGSQSTKVSDMQLEILSYYTGQPRIKEILRICLEQQHNSLLVDLVQKRKTMLSEKKILALLSYTLDDSRSLAIPQKSKRIQTFFASRDIFSEKLSEHQESQLWLTILILQMPMYLSLPKRP